MPSSFSPHGRAMVGSPEKSYGTVNRLLQGSRSGGIGPYRYSGVTGYEALEVVGHARTSISRIVSLRQPFSSSRRPCALAYSTAVWPDPFSSQPLRKGPYSDALDGYVVEWATAASLEHITGQAVIASRKITGIFTGTISAPRFSITRTPAATARANDGSISAVE